MKKVILSSDSTSDLGDELIQMHDIHIVPLYIHLDVKEYKDGIDINPDMIYEYHNKNGVLPTTAAPNVKDYLDHFKKWNKDEYEIIHFTIGSSLSSSYQNALIAAEELENVYIVDSYNLSTGIAMLILEVAKLREKGISAEQIFNKVCDLRSKIVTSFVVDSLLYLKEGGRVSTLQAMGANLLNIKPSIIVRNDKYGAMEVGTKYRGNTLKVLQKYISELFNDAKNVNEDIAFITHSGTTEENLEFVKNELSKYKNFKNIYITRTGCTISSHCGYNTIGIIYKKN
ncbi:MAG: DegV family protein [Helcococcus sp.]|nr:DegV family protein [Helcococcus sp.]